MVMKKILSIILAFTVMFTSMAAVSTEAFAAVPATSINRLTPFKKQIKVFIKKNNKVSGYQVKYAMNKLFKKAKTRTLKGSSKTTLRLMKLEHNKTYYFTVRAYRQSGKKKSYSKWSKVKSTTTNNRMDERYLSLIDEIYSVCRFHYNDKLISKNTRKFINGQCFGADRTDTIDSSIVKTISFMLIDLDNNGIDELIFSCDNQREEIAQIFTLNTGKLQPVVRYHNNTFESGVFGYRDRGKLYGKILYNYGSGGAAFYDESFYKLKKNTNKLILLDAVYAEDIVYSEGYGVKSETLYDKNRKRITESIAQAIRDKYLKTPIVSGYIYVKNHLNPKGTVANVKKVKTLRTSSYDAEIPHCGGNVILMSHTKNKKADGYQYKIVNDFGTSYKRINGNKHAKVMYTGLDDLPTTRIYVRAYKKTSNGTLYSKKWAKLNNGYFCHTEYKGRKTFQALEKAGYINLRD